MRGRKKSAPEKSDWENRPPFEQWQIAARGMRAADRHVEDFLQKALHVIGAEKEGRLLSGEEKAWEFYKKELWQIFADILWEAAEKKDGNRLRLMAEIVEHKGLIDPVRAFVARMRIECEKKKSPPLSVRKATKVYNGIPGIQKTNERTMGRAFKDLGVVSTPPQFS